jgi:excisionase family DNA binding protein
VTGNPSDLLTLQEAAAVVGCHYQTIYRRVRSGDIPALVAGGTYRIRRDDLDAWLASREATAGAVPERGVRDWPQQSETLLELLLAGDVEGSRRLVDRLLAGGATLADLCDRLFAPALFRIGELWRGDDLAIADEHRASRMVEALLERASSARAKPGPRLGSVVVAAPHGDRHALAAQMVAAGLKADGFVVHYLGADLPPTEIVELAEREGADLVALSWCVAERDGLIAALRALEEAGVPAIVGGSGIGGAEALELGAAGYGGSIAEAQRIARELVRSSVAR